MREPKYLIWSEEHGAWWLPGKMGYTRRVAEAGHYSKAEAETIVAEANKHQYYGSGRSFNEVVIPDPLQ